MTHMELTFNTDDPGLAKRLAEIDKMPRVAPARLRIEAALCQWWANRCLEQAGAIEARDRADRRKTELARATRARNRESPG